jgi:hypothetical protein
VARSHAEARRILTDAFEVVIGRPPTLRERQAVQTVALGESSYGQGWDTPEKRAAENWGAIITIACKPGVVPDCPENSFLSRDTYPDGSDCWQCFREYESAEAGAEHLVKTLYTGHRASVLEAAQRGSLRDVSETMYDTGYYTGIGATREARIAWHEKAIRRHYDRVVNGLKEERAFGGGSSSAGYLDILLLMLPLAFVLFAKEGR